ncbi:DNA-directed RNA polymerase subunit omega [Tepidibacillus fermentans]|uniref:DNA-directed RNA polymerase subunit omega n=1 Tax=Tepidibacillus fermentans TaxID=1281767 RepID=A0A4R3KKN5_9BACI|nr:DNA-directed RNA polymerase subunit omega [Tepidibacillus fermentans]TCS84364.1 DNA-directed RNA polymerase subunit omega [Tepidibacillus fermentans]
MLYPSIDKLLEKVESKYILVVAASKRARKLRDGEPLLISSPKSNKYVGKSLEEIYEDQVMIENNR